MYKKIKILVLIIVATFVIVGCSSEVSLDLVIPVEEAYEKYENDAFLLDVRTQEEWDDCHVPNAVHIPLDELPNRLDEVPYGEDVIVMCRSGNRSLAATQILRENDYFYAQSISGGISAWFGQEYALTCIE